MRKKHQAVLALLACSLLIAPVAARASTNLGLQITSGASQATLCDDNVDFTGCTHNANDNSGSAGKINFDGSVGGWNENTDVGLGPPLLHLRPLLDISYSQLSTNGTSDPIKIALTVIGLDLSGGFPTGLLQALQTIGGNGNHASTTISLQAFVDAQNRAFCGAGCGTALTNLLNFSSSHYDLSSSGMANAGSGPYSVTLELTIDSHGLDENETGDARLDIPEPATLSVLGAGLLAFGTGLRKRLLRA